MDDPAPAADFRAADRVLKLLDRAIWLITACHADRQSGLLATWVVPHSIDPQRPQLVIGLAPHHLTAELIAASGVFAAHLLRADQASWALPWALASGRDTSKLAGCAATAVATGAPVLTDSLAWLDCRVQTVVDTPGRRLLLANVLAGAELASQPPLTESQLFAAATAEQRAALRARLEADIARQQPAV